MVLASIGLPLEGIALIAGIDRILDMFRTTVNIVGDASAAVVVAGTEGEFKEKSNDAESQPEAKRKI
jgi:Na+/H+-dicarboxylate symporter